MKILVAGASGFIGRHLVQALEGQHELTVLGRNRTLLQNCYPQNIKICTWESLSDLDARSYDVIINLCGNSIGALRWNDKIKRELIDSRVQTTTDLINWAIQQKARPHFYCANAIGIYGLQKNGDPRAFDEKSPIDLKHPQDFLSEISAHWQEALQPALDYGMDVTTTRFGVVLKKGEGMLKKLTPSYYFGLGSIIGDGKQIISWIHIDDLVSAFLFLLNNNKLTGAFNLTAPIPVSQAQFARTLAKAMHRPLLLKTPAFIIQKLFGEMGECLLLKGQRVVPKRLVEEGYQFRYPELSTALNHEFQ